MDAKTSFTSTANVGGTDEADTPRPPLLLEVDYERYMSYLDGDDLSDDEKRAFIDALWSILLTFVDLGFGVHPVQLAKGDLEREISAKSCKNTRPKAPDMLDCEHAKSKNKHPVSKEKRRGE